MAVRVPHCELIRPSRGLSALMHTVATSDSCALAFSLPHSPLVIVSFSSTPASSEVVSSAPVTVTPSHRSGRPSFHNTQADIKPMSTREATRRMGPFAVLFVLLSLFVPSLGQYASPLFCPFEPSALTPTMFLDPCLMTLNRALAKAVLGGSHDLANDVPEASQFFPSGSAHLDSSKWQDALTQLEKSMRRKVAATNIYTVTSKNTSAPGSGGDKHVYFSLAPYYWPNPSKPDGLPYIERDGFVNPESQEIGDQKQFTSMANDVYSLSLSFYLLGSEKYAIRALTLLNAWYVDPMTSMYPSIEHGQVRRGWSNDTGQPTALIEFVKHVQIVDSLILLNSSHAYQSAYHVQDGMRTWFTSYVEWLRTSEIGKTEYAADNNQHTFFNVQILPLAAYISNYGLVLEYLRDVTTILSSQVAIDGSQPHELSRTNSWHYSCFNLQALTTLGVISQHLCDAHVVNEAVYGPLPDIFAYNVEPRDPYSSRSVLGVLNYLMPYLSQTDGLNWNVTHRQEFPFQPNELVTSIRSFIGIFDNVNYLRPEWSLKNYTYEYGKIADELSPFVSTQITWILSGSNAYVTDAPHADSGSTPSFALLISLFRDYFPFFLPIGIIGVYRWSSFLVRCLAALIFFLKTSWRPRYGKCQTFQTEKDVTLIIPTIDYGPELYDAMTSWLENRPKSIIFVTTDEVKPKLKKLVEQIVRRYKESELEQLSNSLETNTTTTSTMKDDDLHKDTKDGASNEFAQRVASGRVAPLSSATTIDILSVPAPNKRIQMTLGLSAVTTSLTVFSDDDAIWPSGCLASMVACFENPSIGGVGTEQRMRPCRPEKGPTFWEVLADFRLTAKSIENAAACQFGSSVTCLSGRTAAYRTQIFKPSPEHGPYNPHANRFLRGDENGHTEEAYLPLTMLRRRQQRYERARQLPSDGLTREEVRKLMKDPRNDSGLPAVVEEEQVGEDGEYTADIDTYDEHGACILPSEDAVDDDDRSDSFRTSIDLESTSRQRQHQQHGYVPPRRSHVPLAASETSTSDWSSIDSSASLRSRSDSVDDIAPRVSESTCTHLYYQFCDSFLNDFFTIPLCGSYHLHSGDDKFLTRWITTRGWLMHIQFGKRSCIHTTFKPNWHFIKQYMRWTRNTWRSDFRSIFLDRSVWLSRHYWFLIFLMLDKMISPVTLMIGPFLIAYLCMHANPGWHPTPHDPEHSYRLGLFNILLSYACWLILSRAIRLFPHFLERPKHLIYLPMFVIFQYILAPIKIYCLFTLNVVEWGTRKMNGDPLDEPSDRPSDDDARRVSSAKDALLDGSKGISSSSSCSFEDDIGRTSSQPIVDNADVDRQDTNEVGISIGDGRTEFARFNDDDRDAHHQTYQTANHT